MQDLNTEQAPVMEDFISRKHLAILRGAGSGKTCLLRRIVKAARIMFPCPFEVVACANTNRAASTLDGITIHTLVGGPSNWEFSEEKLMEVVRKNLQILRQLKEANVIIIDEISMLKGNVIDSLNYVFRQLSPPHADFNPFGGRILFLCGDPFQLEPVCPPHEKSIAFALE